MDHVRRNHTVTALDRQPIQPAFTVSPRRAVVWQTVYIMHGASFIHRTLTPAPSINAARRRHSRLAGDARLACDSIALTRVQQFHHAPLRTPGRGIDHDSTVARFNSVRNVARYRGQLAHRPHAGRPLLRRTV